MLVGSRVECLGDCSGRSDLLDEYVIGLPFHDLLDRGDLMTVLKHETRWVSANVLVLPP